ncbi:hypothetical protein GCM10009681_15220 [Luedemannella helvata]|uniref:Uncharacterized protein n=1 Tax=Luedemannella helvata TaxID=349315 RepID=A0ABN2K0L8_9ACTN
MLDVAAVDQMSGKVQAAAASPEMDDRVRRWSEDNPLAAKQATRRPDGYSFAVVGETLMYLHRAPDGMVIPHACYPDGTEKVYTDHLHAEAAYG